MLEIDDLGDGRLERVLTQIPRGAPGEFSIRKTGQFGHLIQAEVAGLSKDRGVQVSDQIPGARLGAAGVLERTTEPSPAIDLDQQVWQVQLRQARHDLIA